MKSPLIFSDDDVPTVVVNGGVREVGIEGDGVVGSL